MRLSSVINLGLIAAGAAAALPVLRRRQQWEQANQRAYIVLDYDDALAVSTRAGLPLADFLREAREHGATHVSLPELTLNRLLSDGRLVPVVPPTAQAAPGSGRRWVYLASPEQILLEHLQRELNVRVPSTAAQLLPDAPVPTLVLSGHLPTLAEMGLGFDVQAAAEALGSGLALVPRPVSFAWPEDHLVERTLAQVAGLGAEVVAFEGDLILGHEMHLEATVSNLRRYGLTYAFFAETRHQKGDWFLAKRLAPHGQVVLAHYFTPAAMVPEDFHSAAHHWGMLARSRGIRLCYVNVFRRLHATDPLECLHYLEHVKAELEGQGLRLEALPAKAELPAPDRKTLAVVGLATAGAAALAATETLDLPEPAALGFTALAAAGSAVVPYLDRPRGELEAAYPPSYAPKVLALAGAASAPAAAALSHDLTTAAFIQAGVAAALAAFTTGRDYQRRIEAYRSLNLDLFLPLAAVVVARLDESRARWPVVAALAAARYAAGRITPDVLGALDQDLPAGHTHHLSRAQRLIGDALIALGPRPARKWGGLGLAGLAAGSLLRRLGHKDWALAATLVGTLGSAVFLAAFRQPGRPLAATLPSLARSWAGWGAAAVTLELAAPAIAGDRLDGQAALAARRAT